MLTPNEIDRIAAAANALRPDWHVKSLRTLITDKLADRTRRDVCVALAWVAAESVTTTPARVLEPGPWWQAAAVEARGTTARMPPKRGESCPLHPGEWPDSCRSCAGDALAGDVTRNARPVEHTDTKARVDAIRAALRQTTAPEETA